MKTDELRDKYLRFFEKKGHKKFSSDTLVPDDPTVLFTSAGMNQFKPYFLGEKKDVKSATSCQKCFRTGDLESVGKTPFHHTFFEMLGNFSFGDYFKREACNFAWEFLLKEAGLSKEQLWVSVYKDDEQAYSIWKDEIKVDPAQIVKLGEKDNYWPSQAPSIGPNGPCGPCSEIFFDRGVENGCGKEGCNPSCDCERFVEIWNLVFTQFNRVGQNQLEPLPQKNIDTGMGLERMAAVLQGKYSNFEIDILAPIVKRVENILKTDIKKNPKHRPLIHAVVDHVRAAVFAISDGVYPSNEERGYVIRKLIRKAFWHGYSLGRQDSFVYTLVEDVSKYMSSVYPEIKKKKKSIAEVIKVEEEKFIVTLKNAKMQFNELVDQLKEKNIKVIDGKKAFQLYDTYGLPADMINTMAESKGLTVDCKGFEKCMREAKETSRKKSMFEGSIFTKDENDFEHKTDFTGYDNYEDKVEIKMVLKDKKEIDRLDQGDSGVLVLDKTPFYAESGGQLADKGTITVNDNKFEVENVVKAKDTFLHIGKVLSGKISAGSAFAQINMDRRNALMRAHTATHLLQAALRSILGEHVMQQGSFVDEDRLRFDFTHFKALTDEEIEKIEEQVNSWILKTEKISKDTMSLAEAKEKGALAFFKDKYAQEVRMVTIGDYSKELCGGTHCDYSSQIGFFQIVSESSISSGVRRIEAVVGKESLKKISDIKRSVICTASTLKIEPMMLPDTVSSLLEQKKFLEEKIENLEKASLKDIVNSVIDKKQAVNGVELFVGQLNGVKANHLLHIADQIRQKYKNAFIFLVSQVEKRTMFIAAISQKLENSSLTVANFINQYRKALLLKGGGRGLVAQGVIEQKKDFSVYENALKEFISTGDKK